MRTGRFRFCSYPELMKGPARRRRCGALAAAALAAALPLAAQAQCEWVQKNRYGPWDGFWGFSLAYDRERARPVHFTNGTTWEWDGEGWMRPLPGHVSILLQGSGQAMAYDTVRQRTMLFGGIGGDPGPIARGDLHEYDGQSWQWLQVYGPPARFAHAMVYDTARQRLVVFGGRTSSTGPMLADTWEFDGAAWIDRTPAAGSPAARIRHGMAFDEQRLRTILYGGSSLEGIFDDTWEWDGGEWRQIAAAGPSFREAHAMTYDASRQRTLLFGGSRGVATSSAVLNDLWAWDGAAWELVGASVAPAPRAFANMTHMAQSGQVMLVGGRSGAGWITRHDDTWVWDGEQWHRLVDRGPAPRMRHSVVHDTARGETLIVNGSVPVAQQREIWAWDGARWTLRRRGGGPSQQTLHSAAFDQARGELVYFGGSPTSNSTWTWNGQDWTEHTVAGPSMRTTPAMAYDAARQRIVLFGGRYGSSIYTDTWEWDGGQWTQISAAGPASPGVAVYDSRFSRVILVSGDGTWSFDGDRWVHLAATPSGFHEGVAIEFNPLPTYAGRTMVFGFGGLRNEMWAFDGQTWARLEMQAPPGRDLSGMAWDPDRERIVLFGGSSASGLLEDLWELSCEQPCYANCDGSTGLPLLNIDDFACFMSEYATALALPQAQQVMHYANCDGSTTAPVLNVDDFTCFINQFAAGCP
jgi:hypothetical protein